MDKPIIYKFVENDKIYIYDLATGHIINVSAKHWLEIEKLCQVGITTYKNTNTLNKEKDDILGLLNRGFFGICKNEMGQHPLEKHAENLLDRRISNFTLQVTCDCNFKCRYCQYASSEVYDRNHSKKYMNEKIAIDSLNFLYNHSCDSSIIDIGFYGGEPLLNFNTILKSVQYSKTLFGAKTVRYNITTNGSLLNSNIINFLAENEFDLTLSIDGPEDIQNKHRRFLSNGKGTYNLVYNNILKIKNQYPDYFNHYVKFHPVIMKDDNINNIIHFFRDILVVELDKVSPVYAGLSGIDYYQRNKTKVLLDDNYSYEFITKLDGTSEYKENKLLNNYSRMNPVPSGGCLAGYTKLFVNIHGDLFPCEKVIESDTTRIGSIYDGFNFSAVKRILNSWQLVETECKYCWAFKLCSMCAVSSFCSNSALENKEFKIRNCSGEKKKIASLFRSYVRTKN